MQHGEQHAFEAFAASHPVGTKLCARVANVRAFGAFCELADGVDGLLLVADFAGGPRPMNYPDDYPRVGEQIDVWIEKIIADERKIKLTHRPPAVLHNPPMQWTEPAGTIL